MSENLQTECYRNGDIIPQVTDPSEWVSLNTGAWCYYNNDREIGRTYGKLYNWYAFNDPRGLAPAGWELPTENEIGTLMQYLGGYLIAGGKIKESGLSHWNDPNFNATNESGFNALPAGWRSHTGSFGQLHESASWWIAYNFYEGSEGGHASVFYDREIFHISSNSKILGFSVRCIRKLEAIK
jgi:uncharacterized protein (TIGR02145 family)